jgi:hypothetical protein
MALSLPFGRRGPQPMTEPPEQVQEKFRLLGIGQDATVDEIESAYEELLERYPGDVKRKIDLDVAKDTILEFRLQQRLSGVMKGPAPVSPFDRKEEKGPLIRIPGFLQGVMELPSKAYLQRNLVVFGAIGLLPVIAKVSAGTCLSLGFGTALFLLYQRGAPESGDDEMYAEMRPAKVKPLLLALGITAIAGFLGGLLSSVVTSFVYLRFDTVFGVCSAFTFFLSATLFKVQDEY